MIRAALLSLAMGAISASSIVNPDRGTETKPADGGSVTTMPADGGSVITMPADGGETRPADGGETRPVDGGYGTKPADGGSVTMPADDGSVTRPADETKPADGTEPASVTRPADDGSVTRPADDMWAMCFDCTKKFVALGGCKDAELRLPEGCTECATKVKEMAPKLCDGALPTCFKCAMKWKANGGCKDDSVAVPEACQRCEMDRAKVCDTVSDLNRVCDVCVKEFVANDGCNAENPDMVISESCAHCGDAARRICVVQNSADTQLRTCAECVQNFAAAGGCDNKEMPFAQGCDQCKDAAYKFCYEQRIPTASTACPRPEECAADKKPSRDENGCPTCRPNKCSDMTDEMRLRCKENFARLPYCVNDGDRVQSPYFTSDCCLSCRPAPPPEGVVPEKPCTCDTPFENLSVCTTDRRPAFDQRTCCRDCKPNVEQRQQLATRCTKEEVKRCFAKMEPCEGRETPRPTKGCCASCVRPQRKCPVETVVKQCARVKACEDGEEPTRVDGSCCFSCIPKPKCDAACGDGKVCTRGGCRRKMVKKLAVRVSKKVVTAVRAEVAEQTDADRKIAVKTVLREVVSRFCDSTVDDERARKCERVQEVVETLAVKTLKKRAKRKIQADDRIPEGEGDDFEIELEVVERAAAPTRRLLADDTDIIADAMNDADATEGLVEQIEDAIDADSPNNDDDSKVSGAVHAGIAVSTFLVSWLL